jgi:hypothetical protein
MPHQGRRWRRGGFERHYGNAPFHLGATGGPPFSPQTGRLRKAVEEDTYVASCLACRLVGLEREDGWDAKLAFDEAFGTLPSTRN